MSKRERVCQAALEDAAGDFGSVVVSVAAGEHGLDHLEIAVTQLVPEKPVERLRGFVESKSGKVPVHVRGGRRETREDPAVGQRQRAAFQRAGAGLAFQPRDREARRVPQLGREVPGAGEPLPLEGHRRAGGGRARVSEAKGVRPELLDRDEWVDHVAAGLRHLLSGQTHESVQVDGGEGNRAREVNPRHDHSGDPEEQDVVARDEYVRWIEVFEVPGLLRPAENRERPELRREPGVEDVRILLEVPRAAGLARDRVFFGDGHVPVDTVECRNAVAPPELTGDAPVVDVAHPLEVRLRPYFRHEPDLARFHRANRGFRKGADLDEPLRGQVRLDDRVAALAVPQRKPVRIGAQQPVLRSQTLDDLLAGLETVEPLVLPRVRGHPAVRADHDDLGKAVAARGGEVVGVVSRSHFHDACAELPVDQDRILDDRQLPADDREGCDLAPEPGRPRVVRMDRERGVPQHRFRPGRGDHGSGGDAGDVVTDAVERPFRLLVHDLEVGDRRPTPRAPVDDVAAAVDQTLAVQLDERMPHRQRQVRIERESLARPVERAAESSDLRLNGVLRVALPRPDPLDELLPPELASVDPLLCELFLDHHLGGDARVVGARHPENPVAEHPLPAREDVLEGPPEGVADVKPSGHVGRRDHHDESGRAGRAHGLEASLLLPRAVPALLEVGGIEVLLELPRGLRGAGLDRSGGRRARGKACVQPVSVHEKKAQKASLLIRNVGESLRRERKSGCYSTPLSSSRIRARTASSAASGTTSQATSRTTRSEIFSINFLATLSASFSISASESSCGVAAVAGGGSGSRESAYGAGFASAAIEVSATRNSETSMRCVRPSSSAAASTGTAVSAAGAGCARQSAARAVGSTSRNASSADSTSSGPYRLSSGSSGARLRKLRIEPVKSSSTKPASKGSGGGEEGKCVVRGAPTAVSRGPSAAGAVVRPSERSTRRDSTLRKSWCESNGFDTIASHFSRSARSRSKGSNVPARRTTGIRAVAGFFLISSQTS